MSDRLRPRDLAFLAEESPTTPMHNATVEIFEPGDSGFDYAGPGALIGDRIAFVPRYRQRLRRCPATSPTRCGWTHRDFDLAYHVRRSALPRPGTHDQLRELVARIVSRPLDRSRPLWEMYLVEGLEGGRVAILSKSHQILVDGVETVDLGQVLLDVTPEPEQLAHDEWRPRRRPTPARAHGRRRHRVARSPLGHRRARCAATRPRCSGSRRPRPDGWPASGRRSRTGGPSATRR